MLERSSEQQLIQRIKEGDQKAWCELVTRYEGPVFRFCERRVSSEQVAQELTQETFLGLLNSLPNYRSEQTRLDTFLFSIAANKVRDFLRKQGRRPKLVGTGKDSALSLSRFPANVRRPSSLVRSRESRTRYEQLLGESLEQLVRRWQSRGEFLKLKCIELLFVKGWTNKDVARELGISEQTVANYKHYTLSVLKKAVMKAGLSESQVKEFQGEK